jgi:glucokinase
LERTHYAGIDIGGTKISALVTDGAGRVLGRGRKKSKPERGFHAVMERAVDCLAEACSEAGLTTAQLASVGVGAPSPVLPDGTAIEAPNMGWRNAPLAVTLHELLGLPVYAENDCNVGTYGEFALRGGRSAGTLVGLFMGTGLGGGIVMDGRLVTGGSSMAAEVGHMTVVVDGRPCGCGKRGCLEAYASKTGMAYAFKEAILLERRASLLAELIEEPGMDNVRSALLRRCWDEKDVVVREVVGEAARFLGVGVANLITLLGPETVVLGGGVLDALGKQLLPLVLESARMHTFPRRAFDETRLELASLGDDAVALGALAYAQKRAADARAATNA